jgi:signal transduction histidine kinase/ActR/RegA family two-component response regulator
MLGSAIAVLLFAGSTWLVVTGSYRMAVTGAVVSFLTGLVTLFALIGAASRHFAAQGATAAATREGRATTDELLVSQKSWSERLQHVASAALTINSSATHEGVISVISGEARRLLGAGDCDVRFDANIPGEIDGSMVVPFFARDGSQLGYIHCRNKSSGRFSDDDRAILSQLAHMGAIAIQNSRLYDALRDSDARKDEFLAILAHELRNPLAPIRHSLEVMRVSDDPAHHREGRAVIDRQVSQLVHLVDDLLDVSRISRGKLELRYESVRLADAVASAVETTRPLIEKQGQHLVVTLPPAAIHVHGDMTRLSQVFSNLLNNAAKYTSAGGTITLSVAQKGDRAIIAVRDTGIGISKDALPLIFDLFSQGGDPQRRVPGGLGVGLNLARRLTELHGGTLTASSEGPGKGSEFLVELPATIAEDAPAPARTAEPSADAALRLLVVDDNVDSADGLAMLLSMSGHDVRVAHDGRTAVSEARAAKPDMILLDLGLPEISGYEVAKLIRAESADRQPLIVALTGWGQDTDRQRTRDAGFDHHLVKPVDIETLRTLIASVKPAAR